jgi:hypothetical protein
MVSGVCGQMRGGSLKHSIHSHSSQAASSMSESKHSVLSARAQCSEAGVLAMVQIRVWSDP